MTCRHDETWENWSLYQTREIVGPTTEPRGEVPPEAWSEGRFDAARDVRPEQRNARSTVPPPNWSQPVGVVDATRPAGGSVILDGTGTILAFDMRMERLTGWSAWEVVGQSKDLGLYAPPDEWGARTFVPRPLFVGAIPGTDRIEEGQLTVTCRDGAQLAVSAMVTALPGRGDRVLVEIRRVLSRIGGLAPGIDLADQDSLTRLPGATFFQRALTDAFAQSQTGGHPFALLLVDVDHLGDLNARFGSDRGDDVLRHVAGILRASTRHSDVVARLAADDFGVLLVGAGRGDARHVGGRIRRAIEMFRFAEEDGPLPVTASIGVACFPADGGSPGELLKRGKDALDEVHRLGRNRVWCYVRRPRVGVLTPVYFDGPGGHLLGTSRDLSNSGIFVETLDELPAGMRLGLSFRLPGPAVPIRAGGRIARVVAESDENETAAAGVGIEFERYSDEDRRRLEEFLHLQQP